MAQKGGGGQKWPKSCPHGLQMTPNILSLLFVLSSDRSYKVYFRSKIDNLLHILASSSYIYTVSQRKLYNFKLKLHGENALVSYSKFKNLLIYIISKYRNLLQNSFFLNVHF